MEELISEEINSILNEFNYKIVYCGADRTHQIIKKFKNVGSFIYDGSFLYFTIELDDNIERYFKISYRKKERKNRLIPFFETLKKDLNYLESHKENLLTEDNSEQYIE
jgi:uncharacterized protein YpbB